MMRWGWIAGLIAASAAWQARAADPDAAVAKVDWATYAFDTLRTGYNPNEAVLSPATVGGLQVAWRFAVGPFEAAANPKNAANTVQVDGAPVVVANVPVGALKKDLLIFGDNYGTLFALDANAASPAGKVVWHTALGAQTFSNGRLSKLIGLRSSAVVDRGANLGRGAVYIGVNGKLHALDLSSGVELSGWPVSVLEPNPPISDGSIHDAANLLNGYVYIGTSGYLDDSPPYFGRVARVNAATATLDRTWYSITGSATSPTVSGGGVWGWGGVAIDPSAAAGGVYVGTGNSLGPTGAGQVGFAEKLVDLSPDLALIGSASPSFGRTGANYDNDYGSTPVVFQPAGCPTKFIAGESKSGQLVIDSVAANGTLAVTQSLAVSSSQDGPFHNNAAWDPVDQLLLVTVALPGGAPYKSGLEAFRPDPNCGTPLLSLAWQASTRPDGSAIVPANAQVGSPVAANGLAYFGVGGPPSVIYAVATRSGSGFAAGQVMWQSAVLPTCDASRTMAVVNGGLFALCNGPFSTVMALRVPGL